MRQMYCELQMARRFFFNMFQTKEALPSGVGVLALEGSDVVKGALVTE